MRSNTSNRPSSNTTAGSLGAIEVIVALIIGGWEFIWKLTVVILVVVGGFILIKQFVASHSLSTSSNCQQFQQADSGAQDRVLQQLITEHHDLNSVATDRLLMNLYCNLYGGSAPLEGAYGSGDVGQQPAALASRTGPVPLMVAYSRQTERPDACGLAKIQMTTAPVGIAWHRQGSRRLNRAWMPSGHWQLDSPAERDEKGG
ncbi:MAG: hypothetical protein ACRDHE_16905 [Ktedonobacterales bacterium]